MLGQFVDIDSAVGENARIAINPADTGVCGDNSFETLSSNYSRHSLGFPLFNELMKIRRGQTRKRMRPAAKKVR